MTNGGGKEEAVVLIWELWGEGLLSSCFHLPGIELPELVWGRKQEVLTQMAETHCSHQDLVDFLESLDFHLLIPF